MLSGQWAYNESPLESAMMLGRSLGCPTHESTAIVRCLKYSRFRIIQKMEKTTLECYMENREFLLSETVIESCSEIDFVLFLKRTADQIVKAQNEIRSVSCPIVHAIP